VIVPSTIRSFLPVTGAPTVLATVFDGDPEAWLGEHRRDGATDRWIVTLHAGALHRTVRMSIGSPWRIGATRWRSISWDPLGADGDAAPTDRLLPSFDGELGLHIEGDQHVTLVLDGRYLPPGGRIGTAVDALALRHLAQVTIASFVAEVAAHLSAEAVLRDEVIQDRPA
jgi:hypothetical protein